MSIVFHNCNSKTNALCKVNLVLCLWDSKILALRKSKCDCRCPPVPPVQSYTIAFRDGVAFTFRLSPSSAAGSQLRRRMKNELNVPPNVERLVLGCIDADVCK